MSRSTCEETSICKKFQSAICFHCNRRLCHEHLVQHNKISSTLTNLSNDINLTYQQIKDKADQPRQLLNDVFSSLDQWRIEQIEQIQHTYDNHIKLVQSQCDILNSTENKFYEQLDKHAVQPLEYLKQHNSMNMERIHSIQRTIRKIREDNADLLWTLSITSLPEPFHLQLSSLDISITQSSKSTFVPDHPNSHSTSTIQKKSTSSNNMNHPEDGRPLKRLVRMFSNLSAIKRSRVEINTYLKKHPPRFRLPVLVCCYLTAWYRQTNIHDKVYLLDKHRVTIERHVGKCPDSFNYLIGIQLFFHNQIITENKNEMMTFLLQYFLNHQCINRNLILNWYNGTDTSGYKGFVYAKHLATPFIQSLSTNQIVNNHPTSIHPSVKTEVKQEPI